MPVRLTRIAYRGLEREKSGPKTGGEGEEGRAREIMGENFDFVKKFTQLGREGDNHVVV